jgi:hypothetical protein
MQAPPKIVARCADCRFAEDHGTFATAKRCHRFPPKYLGEDSYSDFPVVGLTEWCGEFQPLPMPSPPSETSKVRANPTHSARCAPSADDRDPS